jgi:hypothetical protein
MKSYNYKSKMTVFTAYDARLIVDILQILPRLQIVTYDLHTYRDEILALAIAFIRWSE